MAVAPQERPRVRNYGYSHASMLPTSGAWVCGEDEVNSNLSDEPFEFSFGGLNIKAIQ